MTTLYRVATAYSYDSTINRLQQRGAALADLQDQLSSGKRVRRVSDDPAAAALAEREQARMQRVQTDQRALDASRRNLELAESTLATVTDLYHRAKELIVQGGNGALNDSDRRTIAQELDGIRERILELANTKDTLGRPLFMGLGTSSSYGKVFQNRVTAALNAYHGTDNRVVDWLGISGQTAATGTSLPAVIDGYPIFVGNLGIEVSTTSSTATVISVENQAPALVTRDGNGNLGTYTATFNGSGFTVTRNFGSGPVTLPPSSVTYSTSPPQVEFEGLLLTFSGTLVAGDYFTVQSAPTADQSIWETLDRAIFALQNNQNLQDNLSAANAQLGQRLDALMSARGQLGDWLNRADSMQSAMKAREDYHIQQQSELTDLDMVEAISRFQTQQLAYQAGLSSYAQVQRLSLFQYLA
ncbi:Flagellar hook-associated protein 3 [Tepidimonas thermarum]|uniref:Flagellin n=1 Tax=Tepidimonas thermarum TaxID=335431 RepID=A0A554X6L9_9BURK|nr:flagellin [Tepidimonas thermarum]TSE31478.1 Flagellar hook-associated protein 3 [Tepidimonas thermarum]